MPILSANSTRLTLDFGNSRDKYAIFRGLEIIEIGQPQERLDQSALAGIIEKHAPSEAILCNTGPERLTLSEWLGRQLRLLTLNAQTPLPFTNAYSTPETLGRDRLALAAGAWQRFSGQPVLAIDAGTCITLEIVNEKGIYLGGIIAPGIRMRLKAMHTFTARLPLVDWNGMPGDVPLIGDSTQACLLAGAVTAGSAELDGLIDRYQDQFPGLEVVLTGGDGPVLAASMKNRIFAVPHLLMEGLNKILTYNVLERS